MNDKTIDELFGSKARARVLKLFFHNPHLPLNLETITAKTSLKKPEIKKVLPSLIRLEIIKVIKSHGPDKKKKKSKK